MAALDLGQQPFNCHHWALNCPKIDRKTNKADKDLYLQL